MAKITKYEHVQNQIDALIQIAINRGGKITGELNEELGYWEEQMNKLKKMTIAEVSEGIF